MQNKTSNSKLTVVSGIQPTGCIHIGNLIGAMNNWVKLQEEHLCIFPVVDMHAITIRQDPLSLMKRCYDFLSQYLAVGIDPKKSIIFIQSHVSGHAELAWILNCYAQYGELSRMTQFKDKSDKHTSNVNSGLFTYPVLMAADILLYGSNLVPVGEDQKQHLELVRDIALRFNNIYGDVFTIPEPLIPEEGARIMKLGDSTSKMSKTDESSKNSVSLLDTPQEIKKKLRKAVTDSEGIVVYDETRKGISNLMVIFRAFSGLSFNEISDNYSGKGFGQFKEDLADLTVETLKPIQERYRNIRNDESYLRDVLRMGKERAGAISVRTLDSVYQKIGFIPINRTEL